MLFFAAEGGGEIIISKTLSGTSYIAGKTPLNVSDDPRELAKWDRASDELVRAGYIKQTGRKDMIFTVTEKGYFISDAFKNDNQINTSMAPNEVVALFEDKATE